MCPDFFPGCCSSSHCCSHNASIYTCICTLCPSRTWSAGVGMFHRLLLKAATHHQYNVPNMCNNLSICPFSFLQDYNVTPFKLAEVVQEEYVLNSGTWLYPRVNAANTIHLSTHHSYCLQSQNRGHKDRPPGHYPIVDDHDKRIINSTTPQCAHIIPWCQ